MYVRIGGPLVQTSECLLRVALQVVTNAELGGKPLGDLVLSLHGEVEVFEPMLTDEKNVRHVDEQIHAGELGALDLGTERSDQDLESAASIRRQVFRQCGCDLPRPGSELELLVAVESEHEESRGIKSRVLRLDHASDLLGHLRPESILERLSHSLLPPSAQVSITSVAPDQGLSRSCTGEPPSLHS